MPVNGTTGQRGYGPAHKRLREKWRPAVERGEVACHRPTCGRIILPGEPWDLGHNDYDRTQYTGPEHRYCNRAAPGKRRCRRATLRTAPNRQWW